MSSARNPTNEPDSNVSVNAGIGLRIRRRRIEMGFSRETFADAAGLTSEQIDKYEGGRAPISARRLFAISELLTVPICVFFKALDSHSGGSRFDALSGAPESQSPHLPDPKVPTGDGRETLELVRAYYRIGDPQRRAKIRAWIANQADN